MIRLALVAIVVAAIAACTAAAKTTAPNVRGFLDRGSVTVTCFPGEPCDPRIVGAFVVFTHAGRLPVRARVHADGSFALRLPPGAYTIAAAPPPRTGQVTPSRARVPRKGVLHLRLTVRGD